MNLEKDLRVLIYDLVKCYQRSRGRARSSLLSVIHDKLVEVFDEDSMYSRTSLKLIDSELVLTLQVALDEDDETEYDSPDIEYLINVNSGQYTKQEVK